MKKETIKTIATATAVVSATALTVNAKADSVTNNPTTENNDKVQTTVTPEQQLQNNVDTTKQALDSASQIQTQAQSKADEANSEVANNQTNVDQAQANVDKAQANQDQATQNLADLNKQNENYDSNLSDAKINVDNAQTAVTNAQGDINAQNEVVNNDTQAVNEANANVNQAQEGVNDAQANVDKAQADLDNANPDGLQKELIATNNTIKEDTQVVSDAQEALDQAKTSDANNAKQVADKQAELNNAQNALNNAVTTNKNAQVDLTSAKNNQASVQADLDSKQKEINDIKSQMGNVNTIVVPSGYTVDKVRKAFAEASEGDTSFAEKFYNTVGKNGMVINGFEEDNVHGYKANAKDDAETVDLENVTPEQQLEINKFAVDLINQVREQLGLSKMILNETSVAIGIEVANLGFWGGHSKTGILEYIFEPHGVDLSGENIDVIRYVSRKTNMSVIKGKIYYSILDMLFKDRFNTNYLAYGRAANFLTNDNEIYDEAGNALIVPAKKIYIGIGVSTHEDETKDGFGIFYEIIPVYEGKTFHGAFYHGRNQNSDFFADSSSINTDTQDYAQQLKQATDELSAKQEALSKAKQQTAQAQANEDKANQTLADAQRTLAKLQANLLNLQAYKPQRAAAQTALTNANQKLADDKKKAEDLTFALQNLAETRTKRQTALNQAKQVLATKQQTLDEAKAQANKAQAKLDSDKKVLADLQAKLTQAQTNLDNAKKALADLENLPERLAQAKADDQKAQADLTSAQAKLDKAKKVLAESQAQADVANEALAQANDDKSQAQSAYDKALKTYNDYLKAQQAVKDAEEKAKAQAQAKAEHTYFVKTNNGKVVDEKGHIMVGYSAHGNQVFDAQSKLVGTLAQTSTTRRMANTVKQENAKALPQTGDKQNNNTTVGAILVGLGSLLGLGALGKRKED